MKKKDSSAGNNNTYAKEQAKHLKRIRSFIKEAQKRGYVFFDKKIPKDISKIKSDVGEYQTPKSVKNPTAVTVKRLEKITKESLYEKAIWIDPETGTVHSAEEGRSIERSRAAKKGAQTRRMNSTRRRPPNNIQPPPLTQPFYEEIARVRGYIEQLQTCTTGWPAMDEFKRDRGRYLMDFYNDCLESAELEGRLYEYTEHLKSCASEISTIVDSTLPESNRETVESNVGSIMRILNEGPITPSQNAHYNDAMEYGSGEEEYR